MLKKILFSFLLISSLQVVSQNTVGTILNTSDSFNGYTLFTKNLETYLIDNCGRIVNQWTSNFNPGNAVYLLEDGSLLKACKVGNTDIAFGGTGGRIEKYDWDGNLTWFYDYSSTQFLQHHDVFPMNNGNILMLAVTVMSNAEAIEAGRDPSTLTDTVLYNEQIIELKPTTPGNADFIWEWNIKNHLVQDFDNSKSNFGIIEDNPQLLDINFLGTSAGKANWLHINSIQYDKNLDQIVLSSRLLSEIYIIDHSTTTAQAATSSGGDYGRGGDILYRWGNPAAYKQGDATNQKLFGQHNPYIITEGYPNAGKLILFNNGFGRSPSFSEVLILELPISSPGNYILDSATNTYGPSVPFYTYVDPDDPTNFFSRFLSNAQMLQNGNILVNGGASGDVFELDVNDNKVWRYIVPITSSSIMSQGDNPFESGNTIFRANRYSPDYTAFVGRDLTPSDPIELNFDLMGCTITLTVDDFSKSKLTLYPNPISDILTIEVDEKIIISSITVFNNLGNSIVKTQNTKQINLSNLSSGIYYIRLTNNTGESITKKIIKL
tara:strand:+ start:4908 stop:6554 length:1647 start_codon:yes stop_codon:yes gene_type:complete